MQITEDNKNIKTFRIDDGDFYVDAFNPGDGYYQFYIYKYIPCDILYPKMPLQTINQVEVQHWEATKGYSVNNADLIKWIRTLVTPAVLERYQKFCNEDFTNT